MTAAELLGEVQRLGIILALDPQGLRVNAPKGVLTPELRSALVAHKAELLRLLASPLVKEPPPPDVVGGDPCPACSTAEWWRWLDGRLICRVCLIRGDAPIVAVKVWSDLLQADVWVVADELPRDAWPTDAPVYTQAEVRILRRGGHLALPAVHLVKQSFRARVVECNAGAVLSHRR